MTATFSSEAIVLAAADVGEEDRILTFLTRERGVLRAAASSARNLQKGRSAALDLFVRTMLQVHVPARAGKLKRIRSAEIIEPFLGIRSDYRRLCAASYMGQTAAHCVQEDDAAAGPFELLAACLGFLDSGVEIFKVLMLFEIRFLKELGMLPELSRCLKCQGSVDRAVSLDPREGGVVHLDCAPVRDDLRLTVGDLSAVKFASSRDLSAVGNLVVREDQAWRIFSSIHAFAVHHLGYESRALRLVAPKDAET